MNKIFLIIAGLFFMNAADAQNNNGEAIANKIAQKMKDSLSLSDTQKSQVYDINMSLHNEKASARQQLTNKDSLSIRIQKIENKRDSLYQTVLPIEKYPLYLQKKRNLVNNN